MVGYPVTQPFRSSPSRDDCPPDSSDIVLTTAILTVEPSDFEVFLSDIPLIQRLHVMSVPPKYAGLKLLRGTPQETQHTLEICTLTHLLSRCYWNYVADKDQSWIMCARWVKSLVALLIFYG